MSRSRHRALLVHTTRALLAASMFASGACHHTPSSVPRPSIKQEQEVRRFAGVDIVPTRAGFLVRVHSGAIGGGDPLYVIDGAPMKIPSQRGIDWFKPEDIAEIKVLKYPYELAEYGSSGANGVIVITTKQNPARRR